MAQGVTAVEIKFIRVINCDATDSAITHTLPTAADGEGIGYLVRKVDSSTNAITVTPANSETLNGSTSGVTLENQYDSVLIVSNGSTFEIVLIGASVGS